MQKNLKELISPDIVGISDDSRKVKRGEIFVAIKGLTSHGHNFIPEVIRKGVKVIVGEKSSKELNIPSGISYLRVDNSREALGVLASEFYDNPSEKLKIIGVTGTKGKTTTCNLIYHILTSLGKKTGLVSSIGARIDGRKIDIGLHVTSPDVIFLQKILKEMVEARCEYAVVEVSSHGIDQERIAGVRFDVGVLTNIAPEHLDYHKTLAEYKRVKLKFIKSTKTKISSKDETDINILPGKFNNLNAQLAVDVAVALGIDKNAAMKTLYSFKLPPGRMQEIENELGINIYIDFAHTPDSLKNVLGYLRGRTKGRLIAVFGCAGDRDRAKRAQMGRIASELADIIILTAEDPRSEKPQEIIEEIAKGAEQAGSFKISPYEDLPESKKVFIKMPERGEAIVFALGYARQGDIVVILGKGHERSLAFGGFEHPWSDEEAVENYLEKEDGFAAIVLAAGRGKRLKADIPKVLYEVAGRPMVAYTLQNLRRALIANIILVTGFQADLVVQRMGGAARIAYQPELLGTADAARCGLEKVPTNIETVLVLNGDDSLFYKPETISEVIKMHQEEEAVITFISLEVENPEGLGRVIRDLEGNLVAIVEEKVANEKQRKIREINDGLYVFNRGWLEANLGKVKKSPVGEYYLVDLVQLAIQQGKKVCVYKLKDVEEWYGINTPDQFEEAKRKKEKILKDLFG